MSCRCSLSGWFGLRRDPCEIILDRCPMASLYFNNHYKFGPRPSTAGSSNDLVIDLTSSAMGKQFEASLTNKTSIKGAAADKVVTPRDGHSTSLLEPD